MYMCVCVCVCFYLPYYWPDLDNALNPVICYPNFFQDKNSRLKHWTELLIKTIPPSYYFNQLATAHIVIMQFHVTVGSLGPVSAHVGHGIIYILNVCMCVFVHASLLCCPTWLCVQLGCESIKVQYWQTVLFYFGVKRGRVWQEEKLLWLLYGLWGRSVTLISRWTSVAALVVVHHNTVPYYITGDAPGSTSLQTISILTSHNIW